MSIMAVIVTYHPNKQALCAQLESLKHQVSQMVIVDNGSSEDTWCWIESLSNSLPSLHCIALSDNLGIAAAQNVGIRWVKAQGGSFVLLMDQDSIPDPGMVAQLHLTYTELMDQSICVAAVGPRFIDADSGRLVRHVRFGIMGIRRISCQDRATVAVDFLISSGSLISISALDAIGLMDESLFIDHVDTEWILRAKQLGWMAYGDCKATMRHSLGEKRVRFWFLRWRDIPMHKPFRYYYIYRNSINLHRRDYISLHWKWVDFIRLVEMFVFMSVAPHHRIQKIQMIWRGIRDGFRGVVGRMPS